MKTLLLTFCALAALLGVGWCIRPASAAPLEVTLPSAEPSGLATNDTIPIRYFAAPRQAGQKSAAVIILHHLGGSGDDPRYDKFAVALNRRGIAALIMTLPYSGRRRTPGFAAHHYYVSDAKTIAQAFSQSASDVSTAVTWLTQRPEIDANRIGGTGVSLGAFVLHLAMGRDARIRAGVAALGAGSIADIFFHAPGGVPTAADIETLRPVDALTYADKNLPRRVLMIQAARDELVPPRYSEKLWKALGQPPIQWADTNHGGLVLTLGSVIRTSVAYLEATLGDTPDDLSRVPRVRALPVRIGLLSGLDTRLTPVVQAQLFGVGSRHHMALLHGDAGLGLRGPFVGVAATVNRHFDIGLGRRVFGRDYRPYASMHMNF